MIVTVIGNCQASPLGRLLEIGSPAVSVIGNCQASPLGRLLEIGSPAVSVQKIPAVHTIQGQSLKTALDTIAEADVVVSQPIGNNFGAMATEEVKRLFPAKRYVTVPSIYFAGALPHLIYLRQPTGGTLQGPLGDYHDKTILRSFLAGLTERECLDAFPNSEVDAEEHYAACVAESTSREEATDVQIMDVVEDRVPVEQTFFTFNHCNNIVLRAVAERVLHQLGVANNAEIKLPAREVLGGVVSRVPAQLLDQLKFDWRQDNYCVDGAVIENEEIVSGFYEVYSSYDGMGRLLKHNKERFGVGV